MLPETDVTGGDSDGEPEAARGLPRDRPAWLQALVAIPAAVFALLPSATCPVCIAAYAGVLSSLGLGFMLSDRVQRPLIVFFLALTVGSVAWATKQHKRFGPVLVAIVGSMGVVAGRLVWNMRWALYVGAACLVVGAAWNLVLKLPQRNFVQIDLS